MAIIKRVTAKDITGAPLAFDLIKIDGSLTGLMIVTEDGDFLVERGDSYGNSLKVTTSPQPVFEDRWTVSAIYKDSSIMSRVFKTEDDAKEYAVDLKTDRAAKDVQCKKGKVAIDDEGEPTGKVSADDDIPF